MEKRQHCSSVCMFAHHLLITQGFIANCGSINPFHLSAFWPFMVCVCVCGGAPKEPAEHKEVHKK